MNAESLTHARAVEFFADVFRGRHHIPGPSCDGAKNVRTDGYGWYVLFHSELATVDDTLLTRLCFLAHDRCLRASIRPAMRYLRVTITPRGRGASNMEDHPTLDEAISWWREKTDAGRIEKVHR